MAGKKESKEKLNHTLCKIVQILEKYKLTDWFIAYGTLLGIVRNESCIHNDDDVDIVCSTSHYNTLTAALKENGFTLSIVHPHIIKTKDTYEDASIDFYMSTVTVNNDYIDQWEKVKWSNCMPLIKKDWNGIHLQLPCNPETKLERRYGADWRTPRDTKGPMQRNHVL